MESAGNGVEKTPPTCSSCCYFVMSGDNVTGNCHAEPAHAIPIYGPSLNQDGQPDPSLPVRIIGSQSLWPPVRPTIDWCGKHPLLRHLGEYKSFETATSVDGDGPLAAEAPPKKRPGRPKKHVEEEVH